MVALVRIITSAGAWGYGPCSTLRLLLSELISLGIVDFVGESVALDFALKHENQFNMIYSDYDQLPTNYDLAISVMEPDLLIWAKKHHIQSVCIDNLYWMWDWNDDLFDLVTRTTCDNLPQGIVGIRNELKPLGNYAYYSTMYTLSDKVYLQRFYSQIPANLDRYRDKIEFIEPIVDLSYKEKRIPEKHKILISFSGMINPYVNSFHHFVYICSIHRILRDTIEKNREHIEFVVAAHASFIDSVKNVFNTDQAYSFDHPQFLNTLNDALLVIAPAGMATMYECLAYEVPLMILPEQHDGNYTNYITLFGEGTDSSTGAISEYYPEMMLSTRFIEAQKFEIETFYKFYLNQLTKPKSPLFEELSLLANEIVMKVSDKQASLHLASEQRRRVCHIIGEFRGIDQLITSIKTFL
ncbi:hypothetical protein D3C77_315130 [compost metagenome]